MKFGDLIKARRNALGLTLQDVGDAAGMTKGHLHDLEAGRHCNPGLYTSARLALVLGLTVQQMAAAIVESNKEDTHGNR